MKPTEEGVVEPELVATIVQQPGTEIGEVGTIDVGKAPNQVRSSTVELTEETAQPHETSRWSLQPFEEASGTGREWVAEGPSLGR